MPYRRGSDESEPALGLCTVGAGFEPARRGGGAGIPWLASLIIDNHEYQTL